MNFQKKFPKLASKYQVVQKDLSESKKIKYSRKQILEAIAHQERVLKEYNQNILNFTLDEGISFQSILGSKGHLDDSDLLNPTEIFNSSYIKLKELLKTGNHINIAEEFKDDLAFSVYMNYVNNMFSGSSSSWIPGTIQYGYHISDKNKQYYKISRGFIGWMDQLQRGKIKNILSPKKQLSDIGIQCWIKLYIWALDNNCIQKIFFMLLYIDINKNWFGEYSERNMQI